LSETSRDGGAERVRYAYDSAGGVTVTDNSDRVTRLAFGLGGQLAQVRDGEGNIVNLGYDRSFQLTGLTGPSGERYSYTYDTNGNLTNINDPLRQTTSFSYETTFNQLAGFQDVRGNGIQYHYDTKGNLERITYEDNTSEVFTYYANGTVKTWSNRRGQTVTSKDFLDTPGIDHQYQYDSHGNLTLAQDPSGTTHLTPDPATGLLKRIEYLGGRFFAFEYNAAGQRTKRTDQDGHIENYNYDSAGRLDTMADENFALIVDYDYDSAGHLQRKTLGNGVYTTYDYDNAGNVAHLVNYEPDASILSRYDYIYDPSGRRTGMSTLDGDWTYEYDPLGQLTHAVFDSLNAAIPYQDLTYV
jgi:YD repeat-containing protein